MHVVIAKVDETYFDGEADSLTAPGIDGELTVMGHHMPIVTILKEGVLTVRGTNLPDGAQTFPIVGGVLEVRADDAIVIL